MIIYDKPEQEYHAPKDELSSTGAKLILESPAKFKHEVIDGNRVHRASYDLGTAVHTKVLGVGSKFVTYPEEHLTPSGNASTKAATREWADEQRANGLVVISPGEAEAMEAMSDAVLNHPVARELFERDGHSEVSVYAELDGVKCRARFDYLPDSGGAVVDLKTTVDASPAGFARSSAKFGYHVQRAHYLDVLKQGGGRDAEMLFVAVEKTAPYLVAVHRLSFEFADMGVVEAREARAIYKKCMESGVWPGYPTEINELSAPMFSVYDFQDRYEIGEINVA